MRAPLTLALTTARLVSFAACGSTEVLDGPGRRCTCSDTCERGLECVDPANTFVSENDASCTGGTAHGFTICTTSCTVDEDCTSFGADVICASNGCDPMGICLRKSGAGVKPGSS